LTCGGDVSLVYGIQEGLFRHEGLDIALSLENGFAHLGYGEFRLIVVTDGEATSRPLPRQSPMPGISSSFIVQ